MTYSIVARCPRTGQLGIGVASYSMAIGLYCDGAVRANTGVTLTQGFPNPRNNYLAINLLALGRTAGQALTELIGNDRDSEYRQVAMVDRDNNAVAGHRIGKAFIAFGDGLAGQQVLHAMEAAFEAASPAGLDEQLLAALEAGRDAGGMAGAQVRLPERSAALIVWGNRTHNEVDLRVDLHDRAIDELRRIYVDYKPSIAYYDERARNPRNAIPAMEFADMLKSQRQKETA
jgi:uncharacterized Ntn-hydrolase superfamily protein